MQLAQKLPGMMGGKKGGNNTEGGFDMSSMGEMLSSMMGNMGQNTGKSQGSMPDMANMASMMANMMGGSSGLKNIQQNAGNNKNTRQIVDENALKRIAKAKQLKQKLRKREQEKNIS